MLRVLNLSKSGFSAWLKQSVSPRAKQDATLLEEIKSVQQLSSLRRSGFRVSRQRVTHLMRGAELHSRSHRKERVSTTNRKHSEPRNVNLL